MAVEIHNARILTPFTQQNGAVLVHGDRITDVRPAPSPTRGVKSIDAKGLYLVPGYIDLHVEGGGSHSVMEGTAKAIGAVCEAHAIEGTTTILPTVTTASIPVMEKAIDAINAAQPKQTSATIAGVHLRGPFLSTTYLETEQRQHALIPAESDWEALLLHKEGIRMVGLSPELPGALAVADSLRLRGIGLVITNSEASYDQIFNAVAHGFTDVSGVFDENSSLSLRNDYYVPGVTECALSMDELTVQLAADGKRLPQMMLQIVFRCKGAENILLASGSNADQVSPMAALVRNMVTAGVSLRVALRMATVAPARRIGMEQTKGRIGPGYDADILLLDDALNVRFCMAKGTILRNELDSI